MAPTQAQYDAAAAAVLKIVQADIAQDVPVFFQGSIPAGAPEQISQQVAKAALDAAFALSDES